MALLALLVGFAPAIAQDSPFKRKKSTKEKDKKKGRSKKDEPPPRGEKVKLSEEELDKALEELDHDDAAVRRAAFKKLYDAREDSKARNRMRGLLSAWTRRYKADRKIAVEKLQPAGGSISSLREQAHSLLKKGDTHAMKPIVEKMFKMVYPDTESAKNDPAVKKAEGRLRELDRRLRWVKDRSRRVIDDVISRQALYADEPAILKHFPAEAANVMSRNRGAMSGLKPEEYRLVMVTNMYRVMMGKKALPINGALCGAAKGHSRDMKRLKFFSHTSPVPGKRTPSDRARAAGTRGGAENIYTGSSKGWDAFWAWFLSLGHHRNMMSDHSQIGIGEYERYWTEMF